VNDTLKFPGWYLDEGDPSCERFWNGASWTAMLRPAPRLEDYLGPIEPLLISLLGVSTDADVGISADHFASLA
jgi:hypothetical protein